MAKALTAKSVDQAKPDPKKRREIPDGLLAGLYLIVQPSGGKGWAIRYRHGGKSRKLTLGGYPAFGLGEAREAAKEALQTVAKGGDPASQKRISKQEAAEGRDLFENVVADFLKRHRTKRDGTVPRSLPEIKRMFEHDVLPRWRGRRIQDITKRDVNELLDGLIDKGVGSMTNRVFSIVRLLMNWAVGREIIDLSPCVGIRPPAAEVPRDRVLSDDEIRRFWNATETQGYPFGPMLRLLLVTGARLSEIAKMPWSELSLDRRMWSLPKERTKNSRAHDVPLSKLAIEIIQDLPKIASTRQLVFTTTGAKPASGYSRAKINLDKLMTADGDEFPAWKFHDLRRTAATGMQRLAIPPHITEAVLNHKSGTIRGVAAVYSRYDYADEKRAALDAWAKFLAAIVEGRTDAFVGKQAKNVVQFPAGA